MTEKRAFIVESSPGCSVERQKLNQSFKIGECQQRKGEPMKWHCFPQGWSTMEPANLYWAEQTNIPALSAPIRPPLFSAR